MKMRGSFRLRPLDYRLNKEIKKMSGRIKTALTLAHYGALNGYLAFIAERVPVLTGATRRGVLEVLEELDRLCAETAAKNGTSFHPKVIPVEETRRQVPGSPKNPVSPDTTRPYARPYPIAETDNWVSSRQEWREEVRGLTSAEVTKTFSFNTAGIFNFAFSVSPQSPAGAYWSHFPMSEYKPEDAAAEFYTEALEMLITGLVDPLLGIFVGESVISSTSAQSTFDFEG